MPDCSRVSVSTASRLEQPFLPSWVKRHGCRPIRSPRATWARHIRSSPRRVWASAAWSSATICWAAPSSSTPSSSTPRVSCPIPTWWCSARSGGARARSSRLSCGARRCSGAEPGWSTPRESTAIWLRPGVCVRWRCDPAGPSGSTRSTPGPNAWKNDGPGGTARRQMELLASLACACLGRTLAAS